MSDQTTTNVDQKETTTPSLYEQLFATKERLTAEQIKGTKVSYANYIETDSLLCLQNSNVKKGLHHHDEHLFIVVHQAFELWFKQILHELDSIKNIMQTFATKLQPKQLLPQEAAQTICHRLHRCDSILRYTLGTFDVLEMMHPADFLEFRDYIGPASGFQSAQMREMEVLAGLEDFARIFHSGKEYKKYFDAKTLEVIEKRLAEPTLKHLVYTWLESMYDMVPADFVPTFKQKKRENLVFQKSLWFDDAQKMEEEVKKELDQLDPFLNGEELGSLIPFNHHPQQPAEAEDVQAKEAAKQKCAKRRIVLLFIMSYRHRAELNVFANILDMLVAFEEAFLLWRGRHVRMVERMIGTRTGTGGSSGVGYLEMTLKYRIFLDLWNARSHFIRPTALPDMKFE